MTSSGNLAAVQVVNNNFSASVGDPTSLVSGTWYHVVAVFASDSSRKIYVNGNAGTTNTTSATLAFTPDAFAIGASVRNIADNYYTGAIDDVRLYNRALSAADVYELFSSTCPNAPFFGVEF